MAKKRKTTKGEKDQNLSKDEPKKASRVSSRNKRKSKKGQNNAYELDDKLRTSVEADGLTIVDMNSDGNCLFRALSDQLYRDLGHRHDEVRSDVCDFMADNEDEFKLFLVFEDDGEEEEDAKDFEHYISNMREDGEWGGNLELVAAARLYKRKITVFSTTLAAFTIEHGEAESSGSDLLVSFHDNDHYNSVHNNQVPAVKTSAKRKTPKKKSKVNSTTEKSNDTKPIKKQDSTVSTTTSMADLSVEDKKSKDVKAQDKKPKEGKPKEDKKSKEAKPKKNSECLCGSGLKYKKCCFAKEKHEARVQKLKENVSKNGDCAMEEDKDDDVVMKGNFRVLQI